MSERETVQRFQARAPFAGIGHNLGPGLAPGQAWRRHCWTRARSDLLPRLPIEVLRRRLRRAAEIGLDYSTFATVRASTGRDILAILFSSNALRLLREEQALDAARAAKLAAVRGAERRALVIAPLRPGPLLERVISEHGQVLDAACAAPPAMASWAQMAAGMDAARPARVPADAVLLVGDTAAERDLVAAGRFAGYLEADSYFPPAREG